MLNLIKDLLAHQTLKLVIGVLDESARRLACRADENIVDYIDALALHTAAGVLRRRHDEAGR